MGLVTPFYVDPATACRPAGSTALRSAQDDTVVRMSLRFLNRITLPTVLVGAERVARFTINTLRIKSCTTNVYLLIRHPNRMPPSPQEKARCEASLF